MCRAPLLRRPGLGHELRIIRPFQQGQMQFGDATAQKPRRSQIVAEMLDGHLVRFLLASQLDERPARQPGRLGRLPRRAKKTGETGERKTPRIAFARNKGLQDCKILRRGTRWIEIDPPGERRHIGKRRPFGQKAPDFQIRIDTRLEATEQLQDEAVAIDDRRVALLGLQDARRQSFGSRTAQPIEALRGEGAHRASGTRHMILSLDQLEQRPPELRIDNSIVEQSIARTLARAEIDVGHHAFGGPRSYLLSACSVRNGQRQHVDLGATAGVFDVDQAESWSVGETGQADNIGEDSGSDALCLAPEPSTAFQETRQLLLEPRSDIGSEQAIESGGRFAPLHCCRPDFQWGPRPPISSCAGIHREAAGEVAFLSRLMALAPDGVAGTRHLRATHMRRDGRRVNIKDASKKPPSDRDPLQCSRSLRPGARKRHHANRRWRNKSVDGNSPSAGKPASLLRNRKK